MNANKSAEDFMVSLIVVNELFIVKNEKKMLYNTMPFAKTDVKGVYPRFGKVT